MRFPGKNLLRSIRIKTNKNINKEVFEMNTKYRIIFFLFFFLIIIPLQANAQPIFVSLPDTIVQQNEILLIPIRVNNVTGQNIFSYQTIITFDQSVLQVVECISENSLSSIWGNPVVNSSTPGQVSIGGFGTSPLSGSGSLVYLKFQVIGSEGSTSQLNFQNFIFNAGNPSVSTTNGSIQIQSLSFVSVELPDTTAHPGDIVLVPIKSADLSGLNVYSYQTIITFDASLLQVQGATSLGSITSDWGDPTVNISTPGQISLGGFGTSPLNGSGNLVYIQFQVIGTAGMTSTMHFQSFVFNSGTPSAATTDGSVNIIAGNHNPVAVDDNLTTDEDTPGTVNVLANDSDPDSDALSITAVSMPANGTAVNNGDGTVTYTPAANYNGADSFEYTISDGNGGMANGTVNIMVTPVNDLPVVVNAITDVIYPEDSGEHVVVSDLNSIFTDPDPGDVLSFSASSNNPDILVIINEDSLKVNSSPDYFGSGEVTVTATDDSGALVSDIFTVTITPVNDPPILSVPAVVSFPEDNSYTIDLDTVVTDVDDSLDSLSWDVHFLNLVENKADSIQIQYDPSSYMVTFIPDSNFYFTNQPVEFIVTDPHGASDQDTVLLFIIPVNDPPVISTLPLLIVDEDDTLSYALSNWYGYVEDPDNADSTLIYQVTSGSQVSATMQGSNFLFIAPTNWFGSDTLRLVVSDGVLSDTSDLYIMVASVNDSPVIRGLPDYLEFTADSLVTLNMWDYAEDVETPNSLLNYQFTTDNDSLLISFDSATGILTISSYPNFSGAVNLFITVTDDSGATAGNTIQIMVNPNAIDRWSMEVPKRFIVYQNYPNPFNPTTTIHFGIPRMCKVKIELYNLLGQKLATILDARKPAGYYQMTVDGTNLSSGVYFYTIQAGKYRAIKKMLLMK